MSGGSRGRLLSRVVVVEDETFIAMEVAEMIAALGGGRRFIQPSGGCIAGATTGNRRRCLSTFSWMARPPRPHRCSAGRGCPIVMGGAPGIDARQLPLSKPIRKLVYQQPF